MTRVRKITTSWQRMFRDPHLKVANVHQLQTPLWRTPGIAGVGDVGATFGWTEPTATVTVSPVGTATRRTAGRTRARETRV